jgi:hypothetical protein
LQPNRLIFLTLIFIQLLFAATWQETLRLALYYEQNGKTEEALLHYEKAWQSSGQDIQVYQRYNAYLQSLQLWAKAVAINQAYYRANPADRKAVQNLSTALARNNQKDQAFRVWQTFLQPSNRAYHDYNYAANALLSARMIDEAIVLMEDAYKRFPQQSSALLQIANYNRYRLRFVESTRYYMRYLDIHPKQFEMIRSRILNLISDAEEAPPIIDFLQSGDARAREIAAGLYIKFGDFKQAIPLLQQVYQPARFQQYRSYLRELKQKKAYREANSLLLFFEAQPLDPRQKRELTVLNFEVTLATLTAQSPIDSIDQVLTAMQRFTANRQNASFFVPVYKLMYDSYTRLKADRDNAIAVAKKGYNVSRQAQDKSIFALRLAWQYFENNDPDNSQLWLQKISFKAYRQYAAFLDLLLHLEERPQLLTAKINAFFQVAEIGHEQVNDVLMLQKIAIHRDTTAKQLALIAIKEFYQKRFARCEASLLRVLDAQTDTDLKIIALDFLYRTKPFTDSNNYATKALQHIQRYPDARSNSTLLWRLAPLDNRNEQQLLEQILFEYPDSPEAPLARTRLNAIQKAAE